jgi:type IV pilus assembly protein PilC
MCVKLSNEVVGNEVIKSGLHQVHADIADGKLFNEALRETGLFPSIVTMMIAIAEEAGSLERSMKLIVDFFEKDIDDTIAAFIATIEPTLTIILGLVITWIAAAVFGPIYGSFEKMDF